MAQLRRLFSLTIIALMLIIFIVGTTPILAQNTDFSMLSIVDENVQQFPDVSVVVRVQDDKGLAVQGLTAEHFSVDEPQVNFNVTTTEEALNVVFIVDLSEMNDEEVNGIETVLQNIANNYQHSGDNFQIITIQDGAVQTVQSSLSAFAQRLQPNGYASLNNYSEATALANSLLHDAVARNENAQIVFVAAYTPQTINAPPSTVPVHTIHVQSSQVQRGGAFGTLTTGHYLRYQGDQARLRDYLDWVFTNNRNTYNITYRSQDGSSANRNITVNARINGQTLTDQFEYQVDLQPPLVSIWSESGFEIARNAVVEEGPEGVAGGYNWDNHQETLTVEVTFPDGYSREITTGELVVEQIALARVENPGERFSLSWDLTPYVHQGGRVFDVSAAVADEFGLVGTSPVQAATIVVNIPEGVAVEDPCLGPDGTRLSTPECVVAGNTEIAIGVLVGLTVGVAALLGVVIWQHRKIASLAAGVATQAYDSVVRVGHTIVEAGSQIGTIIEKSILGRGPGDSPIGHFATFHIIEGPGASSDVTMTSDIMVFGRLTDAGVDHEFRLPNVSKKHCTVRYYSDERVFKITDHHSANKTRVNGIAIEPEVPVVLHPGAEIQLARQNRVLMSFDPSPDKLSPDADFSSTRSYTFYEDKKETIIDADVSNGSSPAGSNGNFTPVDYADDPEDDYEQMAGAHTQIRTSKANLQRSPERNFSRKLPQQHNDNDNGTPEGEGDW